jgi:hypothetical protein
MKIALCFSGKLGNWKDCSESITENIIWPLKPDVFVTIWEDQPSYDFCKYYNPVKTHILNFDQVMKYLKPQNRLPMQPNPGLIPMLAGMKICNTVYNNYALRKKIDYDLVIRLRPDIQVLEQIKKHELKDCIKNKHIRLPLFESTNIYDHETELKKEFSFSFVNEKASLPNQVNDQFAIGHPDQMNKYMDCLSRISTAIRIMWESGYPEYMIKVPESVITMCLQLQHCKWKQLTGSNSFGNIKTLLFKDGKKWRNKGHNSLQVND